ncbi:MAG TPA: hypothetical protein VFJ61_06055 [Solirubrobacterales bacterium]|nr:hypothetical protein [Solirubrobacterales bacterium]
MGKGGAWFFTFSATLILFFLLQVAVANAISAPIHIANTGGEGVFIRPEPNTSRPAIGWIPEGASPDYNCFAWGQNINGVPIWFNVNYNGKTGFYASYYDDSSYHSNEELTAKYGVPLCGSAPEAAPAAPASPPASTPPAPAAPPPPPPAAGPRPAAVYFNPYSRDDPTGAHLVDDGATLDLEWNSWRGGCSAPRRAYAAALEAAKSRPVTTVSGWSGGRLGILSFLANATLDQLRQVGYVLLIDPEKFANMACDREAGGGDPYVRWLHVNPSAHLVVISGEVTQESSGRSRGIQESYFNDLRRAPYPGLRSRVLVCNYPINHQQAFWSAKYWIQHQIDTQHCPTLLVDGHRQAATFGWHP